MIKIAISGSFSVGKTQLIESVRDALAELGQEGIIVPEAARDCPMPINRGQTPLSSAWIVGLQIHRESFQRWKHPRAILLCDRSSMDVFGFLSPDETSPAYLHLLQVSGAWARSYDTIFYQSIDPDIPVESDGVRIVDADYRSEVDQRLREILHRTGIGTVELTGDINERIQIVLEHLNVLQT